MGGRFIQGLILASLIVVSIAQYSNVYDGDVIQFNLFAYTVLTQSDMNKMASILQTTFSSTFSGETVFLFDLLFNVHYMQ